MSYEAIQQELKQIKQENANLQARLDKLNSCPESSLADEASKELVKLGVRAAVTVAAASAGIPLIS